MNSMRGMGATVQCLDSCAWIMLQEGAPLGSKPLSLDRLSFNARGMSYAGQRRVEDFMATSGADSVRWNGDRFQLQYVGEGPMRPWGHSPSQIRSCQRYGTTATTRHTGKQDNRERRDLWPVDCHSPLKRRELWRIRGARHASYWTQLEHRTVCDQRRDKQREGERGIEDGRTHRS